MKKLVLTSLFLFIITLVPSFAQTQAPASLYDRLGGAYAVSAVVDDFIDKLLADPVITANQSIVTAMNRINKAGLKFHITEFVCQVTGGPQKYTGRTMKESHEGLKITEAEWGAMVKDFIGSLKKFNVPEKEQNELVSIVGTTKPDIVTAKPDPLQAQTAPAPAPPAPPKPQGIGQAQLAVPKPPSLPSLPNIPSPPNVPAPPAVPAPEAL